jgi:hypothetical protein
MRNNWPCSTIRRLGTGRKPTRWVKSSDPARQLGRVNPSPTPADAIGPTVLYRPRPSRGKAVTRSQPAITASTGDHGEFAAAETLDFGLG